MPGTMKSYGTVMKKKKKNGGLKGNQKKLPTALKNKILKSKKRKA
jgi:hypothetical protein|tara:strand:- start:343 stop:477 length:135 start_codon:yes stop_codon:yes gene_type:complete